MPGEEVASEVPSTSGCTRFVKKDALFCSLSLLSFYLSIIAAYLLHANELDCLYDPGKMLSCRLPISVPFGAMFLCFLLGLVAPKRLTRQVSEVTDRSSKKVETKEGAVEKETSENETVNELEASKVSEEADRPTDELTSAEPVISHSLWRDYGVDEEGTPKHPAFQRFLIGEFNNMKVALKRWEVSCDWRESKKVESMLLKPHKFFEIIKQNYPHGFLGRSKLGYPIYVERPGQINLKALYAAGASVEDVLYHYIYVTEYAWKHVEKEGSPTAKFLTILDLQGVRFKDFFGDAVAYLKSAVSISQTHYPETSYKIFVINIPGWFNVAFKLVKPFMAEATLKKVRIYRHGFEKELLEDIDAELLPERYGGKLTGSDYEAETEKGLWKYVFQSNLKHGCQLIKSSGEVDETSVERMTQYCADMEK